MTHHWSVIGDSVADAAQAVQLIVGSSPGGLRRNRYVNWGNGTLRSDGVPRS